MTRSRAVNINAYSVFLVFAFVFLFQHDLIGQTFTVGCNNYQFIDGKWYYEVNGQSGNEIIPSRLIIRLQDGGDLQQFNFNALGISSGLTVSNRFLDGFYVLSIQNSENSFSVAQTLDQSGLFEVIEFDAYGTRTVVPNDPLYSYQWNLKEDKIRMESTWDFATGDNSVILAIIDSGRIIVMRIWI